MTDLRTELGGIISNFQVSVEGMEYSDKGRVNYYNKQLEEALTAILKLIEERYVEREKSDILAREYVDNYWRERSCDFISHQEAYEIAEKALPKKAIRAGLCPVNANDTERYNYLALNNMADGYNTCWSEVRQSLRTAFKIPEGKE